MRTLAHETLASLLVLAVYLAAIPLIAEDLELVTRSVILGLALVFAQALAIDGSVRLVSRLLGALS